MRYARWAKEGMDVKGKVGRETKRKEGKGGMMKGRKGKDSKDEWS